MQKDVIYIDTEDDITAWQPSALDFGGFGNYPHSTDAAKPAGDG